MIDRDTWIRFCAEELRRRDEIVGVTLDDVLRMIDDFCEIETESLFDSTDHAETGEPCPSYTAEWACFPLFV